MERIGSERESYVHNPGEGANLSDAVINLERDVHEACCASYIVERLMQAHFDGVKEDPDGYFRIVMNRDELEGFVHAVYHAGDSIREVRKEMESALDQGLLKAAQTPRL